MAVKVEHLKNNIRVPIMRSIFETSKVYWLYRDASDYRLETYRHHKYVPVGDE